MDITEKDVQAALDMFAPEPLHPDLIPYLQDRNGRQVLVHPLVFDPFYFEPMNRHKNLMYTHKKAALAKAAAEGEWHRYTFLHEKPFRLDAVLDVLHQYEVSDPEIVWPLVGDVWTNVENIHEDYSSWYDVWNLSDSDNINPIERRELAMDEDERAAFAALPDALTIYRGTGHPDAIEEGFSWTLDRKKAIWFAKRYSHDLDRIPSLGTGTIGKSDVIAHFLGRNESEIVVLPNMVNDVKITKVKL